MSELKPCPFCGDSPNVQRWKEFDRSDPEPNEYECSLVVCPCTVDMDINTWNTRTPDPRIAELEAENAKQLAHGFTTSPERRTI